MKHLVLFDFDGTITKGDSFFKYLKFISGKYFYLKMMLCLPYILMYFIKIMSAQNLKEKILWRYLKYKEISILKSKSVLFIAYLENQSIIKKSFIVMIEDYKKEGAEIAVVSASPDLWIDSFCEKHNLISICTKLEVVNDFYTGSFLLPNCNGKEKANRILQKFKVEEYEKITAYGNSSGDKEMLELAKEKHMV